MILDEIRGPFRPEEFPLPRVEPRSALLRTELCGICATDNHIWRGEFPASLPSILGHEIVARVEGLGDGLATDYTGRPLAVGDLVAPKAFGCGRCYGCVVAKSGCTDPRRTADYGLMRSDQPPHLTGGFGQYLFVDHPFTALFKIDAPVTTAVLVEPLAAVISGVQNAPVRLGDTVVVQGVGAIGLLTLGLARLSGATRLIAVGGPRTRLDLARELGAQATIDLAEVTTADERIRAIRAATPGGAGADVVFGCVGRADAVAEGLACAKRFGTMVEIGNASDVGPSAINTGRSLVQANLTVRGHMWETPEDWVRAVRLLEAGLLPYGQLVSHRVPLNRVGEAVATLDGSYRFDGRDTIKLAVDPWLI
jgi:L-iditol 2-dehydrogenase